MKVKKFTRRLANRDYDRDQGEDIGGTEIYEEEKNINRSCHTSMTIHHGSCLQNILIDKVCFENLLTISRMELTPANKIRKLHFDLKVSDRQKVRPAVY